MNLSPGDPSDPAFTRLGCPPNYAALRLLEAGWAARVEQGRRFQQRPSHQHPLSAAAAQPNSGRPSRPKRARLRGPRRPAPRRIPSGARRDPPARRCPEGRPRVRPGLPPPLAGGRRLGGSRPGSEASRPLPPPPDVRPARRGSGSLGSAPRRLSLSAGEAQLASPPAGPDQQLRAGRRRGVGAPRQPGRAAPAGPFASKAGKGGEDEGEESLGRPGLLRAAPKGK